MPRATSPESELARALGLSLAKMRVRRGLTQPELGRVTGLSEASIRRYEDGSRTPSWAAFFRLAWALDVAPSELLSPLDRFDAHAEEPIRRTPQKESAT